MVIMDSDPANVNLHSQSLHDFRGRVAGGVVLNRATSLEALDK
jgi:hypothetical protein